MAFFKFRFPGQAADETQRTFSNNPAESVEAIRRRARHRLIGACVLVVVGVVGFPLLFDTQPRPVSAGIRVEIPDRAERKPLANPSKQKSLAVADAALDSQEEGMALTKSDAKPELKSEFKPVPKPAFKQERVVAPAKPEITPKANPVVQTDIKVTTPTDDNKPSDSQASSARFVVQVGAFADESKAHNVRAKLEKAGFKTYTHIAQTKDGPRTRVRVGPFTQRDEADKAAQKIKQLQLQPQVLTL